MYTKAVLKKKNSSRYEIVQLKIAILNIVNVIYSFIFLVLFSRNYSNMHDFLLKKHFWLLLTLKMVFLFNILVETQQHLFEIEIFCNKCLFWSRLFNLMPPYWIKILINYIYIYIYIYKPKSPIFLTAVQSNVIIKNKNQEKENMFPVKLRQWGVTNKQEVIFIINIKLHHRTDPCKNRFLWQS